MDNFDRAQRDWETPPDEPEAVFCEDCGQEVEYRTDANGEDWNFCGNHLCPNKFDGKSKEMAILIVEQKESIESLQRTLKHIRNKLIHMQDTLEHREDTIEKLEKKISALEFHRDEGE
jgi:hypothetical protein